MQAQTREKLLQKMKTISEEIVLRNKNLEVLGVEYRATPKQAKAEFMQHRLLTKLEGHLVEDCRNYQRLKASQKEREMMLAKSFIMQRVEEIDAIEVVYNTLDGSNKWPEDIINTMVKNLNGDLHLFNSNGNKERQDIRQGKMTISDDTYSKFVADFNSRHTSVLTFLNSGADVDVAGDGAAGGSMNPSPSLQTVLKSNSNEGSSVLYPSPMTRPSTQQSTITPSSTVMTTNSAPQATASTNSTPALTASTTNLPEWEMVDLGIMQVPWRKLPESLAIATPLPAMPIKYFTICQDANEMARLEADMMSLPDMADRHKLACKETFASLKTYHKVREVKYEALKPMPIRNSANPILKRKADEEWEPEHFKEYMSVLLENENRERYKRDCRTRASWYFYLNPKSVYSYEDVLGLGALVP